MKAKIRVYGKSQSRTALGIINAYLKLFPNSTMADLQQAFPKSLNAKSFTDNIIVPEKETKNHEKLFFEREDELIVLKNGERLALVEVWNKDDFHAICEHAKQYGVEVAKLEGTKPFEKGSYELEYINEYVPPVEIPPAPEDDGKKKRKFRWWWILLLIILLILILLFCCKKCCCSNKCSNSTVTPVENVMLETPSVPDAVEEEVQSLLNDTGDAISIQLPDGQEWKIKKNTPEFELFNFLNSDAEVDTSDDTKGCFTLDRLRFKTGKVNLTAESEEQLKNIAMIMKYFPNAQIRMDGHTDNTGTDAVNMRLSAERAKIAVDKLVALGIESKRLTSKGYGSKRPVCTKDDSDDCRAKNRRIDVNVTRK